MARRSGVSLVEVLVATVLLAIGVAGCVAALQAASRLRLDAATREGAVATVERRLTWFESRGCLGRDTVIVVLAPDTERWILSRDSTGVTMDGRAEGAVGARFVRVPLRVRRGCP
jgi:prepilin-type N-terminal cleavage/methylation domain-containing protein